MIFKCFLGRFGVRFGRPRGMESKSDQKRTKIDNEKEDAKRSPSRLSWGGLGVVLERSWAILAELEAILGRLGVSWGGQNRCCFLRFFDTFYPIFRIKIVILAGLGSILGPLGANLGPLGPILALFGRPRGPNREPKTIP